MPVDRRAGAALASLLLAILLLVGPARAEPVFVNGGGIGMEPLEGFEPATEFNGFEHATTGDRIMLTEIPLPSSINARRFLRSSLANTQQNLAARGYREASRRELTLPGGEAATLISGHFQQPDAEGDYWYLAAAGAVGGATIVVLIQGDIQPAQRQATERMLQAVVLRPLPSLADRLATLPYAFDTSTRFTPAIISNPLAILVSEGSAARMVLFLTTTGPVAPGDREDAARLAFDRPSVAVQIAEPVFGAATPGTLAGQEAVVLTARGVHPASGRQMEGTIHMAFLSDGRALAAVEVGPTADYRGARTAFDIIRNSLRLR